MYHFEGEGRGSVGRCQELGYTGEYLNIVLSITLNFLFALYHYTGFSIAYTRCIDTTNYK
jgi:hypothetical protein